MADDFDALDVAGNAYIAAGTPQETAPETPDAPAEPAAEAPPEGASAPTPETADADLVEFPGGVKVPIAELIKWAGGQAEVPATEAAPPPVAPAATPEAMLHDMVKRLVQEQMKAAAPAPQAPQQSVPQLDPRTHPQDWMNLWARLEQQKTGRQVTLQDAQFAMGMAQKTLDRQEVQELKAMYQAGLQQAQVTAETTRVQQEINSLVETKYPNLKSEVGQQVLSAFLAQAAARGEKDMEKVVRSVSELAPKFISATWANQKRNSLRAVSSGMPRAGGVKAPAKKDYGNDFDAIDRVTADLMKR